MKRLMIRLQLVVTLAMLVLLLEGIASANATIGPDESKLRPNAVRVAEYVKATYPEVPEIGGWRADSLPDHPTGHAIDIMVFSDVDLGNRILDDLMHHPEFGIRYMIWRQHLHRLNGADQLMANRGSPTANHFDHVHVTVT